MARRLVMQHTKVTPRRGLLDNPLSWSPTRGTFVGPYDDASGGDAQAALLQAADPCAASERNSESDQDVELPMAEPEAAVFERSPTVSGDADWLRGAFRESGALCVLEVSEDREVVINVPAYRLHSRAVGCEAARVAASQQSARINPFSKVKLRLVEFIDAILVCAVCDNPGCDRSVEDATVLANVIKRGWHLHRSAEDVLGGRPSLCRCAHTAVSSIWRDGLGSPTDTISGAADMTFCAWLREQDPLSAYL